MSVSWGLGRRRLEVTAGHLTNTTLHNDANIIKEDNIRFLTSCRKCVAELPSDVVLISANTPSDSESVAVFLQKLGDFFYYPQATFREIISNNSSRSSNYQYQIN
ncbi:hypothetical protein WA026_021127 [Henosepilachna vigintioctopunctata]|uniref:Uncharacterized protein n=1 Tax=Henosepilachna vigintioctopunctata TaxID=420089 RepID=A0AAW1U2T8_9CUCU